MLGRTSLVVSFCTLVGCLAETSTDPTVDPGTGSDTGGGDPTAGTGDPGTLDLQVTKDLFRFGIVGDTRPAGIDGTSHYPKTIITKIYADMEAESPKPDFAVTTGDYMFARTNGTQATPQMDMYLNARAQFTGPVYYALGNHECTGATTSNCGPGTTTGSTKNFTVFMNRMIQPLGFNSPYYVVNFHGPANTWTAKLVVVAGNAWTPAQATWLETTLAKPTTYTFVARHESTTATTAPGVKPSTTIINKHPLTLLIVGHQHTYLHVPANKEVIVGNGGAPLVSQTSYGYGMVERRADGAIKFTELDYQTHAKLDSFVVRADGTPTN
ncbi:MAG: hypothetical protein JWO36_4035 [Myxococcales bacterium]|nr:hypothetical protein [Myxococcales bacterium]